MRKITLSNSQILELKRALSSEMVFKNKIYKTLNDDMEFEDCVTENIILGDKLCKLFFRIMNNNIAILGRILVWQNTIESYHDDKVPANKYFYEATNVPLISSKIEFNDDKKVVWKGYKPLLTINTKKKNKRGGK